MKGIVSIIVLALIAGAGWWFYQSSSNAPVIPDTAGDEMMGEHMMDDGGTMGDDMMESGMPTMEDGTIMEKKVIQMDGGMMSNEKSFNVTNSGFTFTTKEIRVKKGDTVTVNFESAGVLHDWTVDEFNAHTQQVQPGTKTSTTFTADKIGTFEYYCSVGQHRSMGMVGKLIVEQSPFGY